MTSNRQLTPRRPTNVAYPFRALTPGPRGFGGASAPTLVSSDARAVRRSWPSPTEEAVEGVRGARRPLERPIGALRGPNIIQNRGSLGNRGREALPAAAPHHVRKRLEREAAARPRRPAEGRIPRRADQRLDDAIHGLRVDAVGLERLAPGDGQHDAERAETLGEVRQRDVRASSARPRLEGDLLETPRVIYQRVDRSLREATDETSKGRFVDAVPHCSGSGATGP